MKYIHKSLILKSEGCQADFEDEPEVEIEQKDSKSVQTLDHSTYTQSSFQRQKKLMPVKKIPSSKSIEWKIRIENHLTSLRYLALNLIIKIVINAIITTIAVIGATVNATKFSFTIIFCALMHLFS